MTQIIAYFVWLLNNLWALALLIVLLALVVGIYQFMSRHKLKDTMIPTSAILALLVVLPLLFFVRSYVTSPLIYHFGVETNGRVVGIDSVPETYNEQQVYRHNVIFQNEADDMIETSFKTSDFNVYPIANSVRYPNAGEDFTLRYMEDAPSEFVIVRDEGEERLSELRQERSALLEKLDFDPSQTDYLIELEAIEQQIQELEQEEKETQNDLLDQADISYEDHISEIEVVDGLHYSPTQDIVLAEVTYHDFDGHIIEALLSISLVTQTLEHVLPLDPFEDFVGVSNDIFYIHGSEGQLLAFALDTFEQVDLPLDALEERDLDPLLVGNYLFDYENGRPLNAVYHLETEADDELSDSAITHIIQGGEWHLLTPDQQNLSIEKLLALKTNEDYRQYFTEVLADETMSFEHDNADSGLFFSEDEEEIGAMTYMLTDNILFRSNFQTDFKNDIPANVDYKIIGIEERGSLYGLTLGDGQVAGWKKDQAGDSSQTEIDWSTSDLDFATIHLEDRFLLLNSEGLFELSKEGFTLTNLFDFESNL